MKKSPPPPDFDAHWKTAVEKMHIWFMHLFFPNLSSQIDFTVPVRFMDKEFQKLFPDWVKLGWTAADKLLEYQLKNREKQFVLIHFEAHGGHDADFKRLQFIRFYRILDKFPDRKLTQIVIYTGETIPHEPGVFRYEFEGTKNTHEFNTYIVRDQDRGKLEQQSETNPFALVLLAALEHIATMNDAERRRRTKIRLIRLSIGSPFKNMIGYLLTFVEFTIALPEDEELVYREELETIIDQPMQGLKEKYPEEVKTLEMLIWGKDINERIAKQAEERAEGMAEAMAVEKAEKMAVGMAEKMAEGMAVEKAEKMAEKMAEGMAEKMVTKLVEQKTLRQILDMHKFGIQPEKIASIMDVKEDFVLKIIRSGGKGTGTAG